MEGTIFVPQILVAKQLKKLLFSILCMHASVRASYLIHNYTHVHTKFADIYTHVYKNVYTHVYMHVYAYVYTHV